MGVLEIPEMKEFWDGQEGGVNIISDSLLLSFLSDMGQLNVSKASLRQLCFRSGQGSGLTQGLSASSKS